MNQQVALFVYPLAGIEFAELVPMPFTNDPGPEWVRVSEWVSVDFPKIEVNA